MKSEILPSFLGDSEDFQVDPSSGIISKLRCIDAENSNLISPIKLVINATNPKADLQPIGSTDVTFVIRDLNDNAPTFDSTPYIVRWPYLASSTDVVEVQATDKDVVR